MPSPSPLNEFEMTGRSRSHLVDAIDLRCTLHREVMSVFIAMREAALADGLDLRAASSFRDFDRQLAIWNGKFRGERTLLDREGRVLETTLLTPDARIEAILAWSALPGASRHHWGTDFDVYDAIAMPDLSALQLVPQEYAAQGPFAKLTQWLDTHMHRFGFFRPYVTTGDGVSAEPWHLSFAPLAVPCLEQLSPQLLSKILSTAPLEGRTEVLARIDEIHRRYVAAVEQPATNLVEFEFGDHRRMV